MNGPPSLYPTAKAEPELGAAGQSSVYHRPGSSSSFYASSSSFQNDSMDDNAVVATIELSELHQMKEDDRACYAGDPAKAFYCQQPAESFKQTPTMVVVPVPPGDVLPMRQQDKLGGGERPDRHVPNNGK